jgi:glycyl-tRNA synthetase
VGNADRACYDLTVHENASGKSLSAFVLFPGGPQEGMVTVFNLDKGLIGRTYRKTAQEALSFLDSIKDDESAISKIKHQIETHGEIEIEGIKLNKSMITFKTEKRNLTGKSIKPSVIEPAFGLGRILYSILEHSFYIRSSDRNRHVLSLNPIIAPYKVALLPILANDDAFLDYLPKVTSILKKYKISYKVDTVAAIGRRYARMDEIGCPFDITIDHESLKTDGVTLRERDTTRQVRIHLSELGEVLQLLINEEIKWKEVTEKYPLVPVKEDE